MFFISRTISQNITFFSVAFIRVHMKVYIQTIHKTNKMFKGNTCPAIVLASSRGSGKTTWARTIFDELVKSCGESRVICGNDVCISEWADRRKVSPERFKKNSIADVLQYQRNKIHEYVSKPIPKSAHMVVVIEDCFHNYSAWSKEDRSALSEILIGGIRYGIKLIITVQLLKQINPCDRANIDYLGITGLPRKEVLKRIYTDMGGLAGGDLHSFQEDIRERIAPNVLCIFDTASGKISSYKDERTLNSTLKRNREDDTDDTSASKKMRSERVLKGS